jgi:SAM-dependent methyltransferase
MLRRDVHLRETFDDVAELYDRARPGYPPELFDDLERLAGLRPGSRVLELGCGTGQATVPLAERGYEVVAVELGAALAAIARRNLARFPSVRVELTAFEDWPLPREPFDAVVSATAFHWLDPSTRVTRTAAALRPGGALAVVSTHHVAGDDGFFAESQRCYLRWDPSTVPGHRQPRVEEVPEGGEELARSGRFDRATVRRYERDLEYATEEYLDVLRTYSGHLALAPDALAGLLDCLRELIETRFGGRVTKRYLTELCVARRR